MILILHAALCLTIQQIVTVWYAGVLHKSRVTTNYNQQREDLCKPLTQSVIKNYIQLLPNIKPPGPDGFCAEFYD